MMLCRLDLISSQATQDPEGLYLHHPNTRIQGTSTPVYPSSVKGIKMVSSKRVVFNSAPSGFPVAGKDLILDTVEVDLDNVPQDGVITKNLYVSFDPYQRGRMSAPSAKSYTPGYTLHQAITNDGISQIVKSGNPNYKEGELCSGHTGTEEYTVHTEKTAKGLKKIHNPYNLPLSYFLDGLLFFFSAVSVVLVAYIKNELKFDEAFNYKNVSTDEALKKYAPDGIDIYYDNVGGEALDAALFHGNLNARFIECGMISQYNLADPKDAYPIRNMNAIIPRRYTIRGFIVGDADFGPKYHKEHQEKVGEWLANKELIYRESVSDGLDNAINGLLGLFHGRNFGKAVLRIADIDQ
ncbi:GroES-like protein [Tuber magnatum]|uniref:GroES-like protein n=1 Tax=Tuber magnatum TaxID=42249 RepID=A0A317SPH2_9PEZI|nr:GroES-like protein [Tuber magnatum]